jgi:hypothetical protein
VKERWEEGLGGGKGEVEVEVKGAMNYRAIVKGYNLWQRSLVVRVLD